MMTVTAEKTKAIRAALKEAGITSKQVSVKHRYCGYSSSYHITIKDGNVSELQIKDICKRFESVDYDERTGEILEGGNDYVFVDRDYRTPVDGSEYLDAVKNALSKLERKGQGVKIERTRWMLFKEESGEYFGNCPDYEKFDYTGNNTRVSRFRCPDWNGIAESIAAAIKSKELDAAYLTRKNA